MSACLVLLDQAGFTVMGGDGSAFVGPLGFLVSMLGYAVHLAFAVGVYLDAERVERNGERLVFFGSLIWAAVVLILGPLVAFGYWLIHHSTLRREDAPGGE